MPKRTSPASPNNPVDEGAQHEKANGANGVSDGVTDGAGAADEPVELSTLAITVKKLRDQRVWSQYRLAQEAGVHYSYIQKLEGARGGIKSPSMRQLQKVAAALDTTAEELMAGDAEAVSARLFISHGQEDAHHLLERALRYLQAQNPDIQISRRTSGIIEETIERLVYLDPQALESVLGIVRAATKDAPIPDDDARH